MRKARKRLIFGREKGEGDVVFSLFAMGIKQRLNWQESFAVPKNCAKRWMKGHDIVPFLLLQ